MTAGQAALPDLELINVEPAFLIEGDLTSPNREDENLSAQEGGLVHTP
jgi:hypothetical protein